MEQDWNDDATVTRPNIERNNTQTQVCTYTHMHTYARTHPHICALLCDFRWSLKKQRPDIKVNAEFISKAMQHAVFKWVVLLLTVNRAGSNYTKSLQLQLQLLWNIDFNYNYNYTIIMLYSITITPCSFQLQLQFHFYVNYTFLWWNIGLIDFGLFPSFGPSTV